MNERKKILITYQYFLPAYKAGGPIQSIANLCRQLKDEYSFYIICGDSDHKVDHALSGIKVNAWNDFEDDCAKVFYISSNSPKKKTIIAAIREVNPDYLFVNGIFSPVFSIVPLLYAKCKKIISVRGMLHPGALSQKHFKKRLFISFLKMLQISKKVTFHATDENEKIGIRKTFGSHTRMIVAQNFPNASKSIRTVVKSAGELKMVSIALISAMKNHALVLEALKTVKVKVRYDIYGPIKDIEYWNTCLQIMGAEPINITVNYKGSIDPSDVSKVLSNYHCFALPSKSENFSHAIFEALSSGLPVITSHFTPWNELEQNKAGWNVDISSIQSIAQAIEAVGSFDNKEYEDWSRHAIEYAQYKINLEQTKQQYVELFN